MEDFILYKLPQQSTFNFINGRFEPISLDPFKITEEGFLFANFDNQNTCFYLKGKQKSISQNEIVNLSIPTSPFTQSLINQEIPYQQIVTKAKQLLQSKDAPLSKVVLANQKFISAKANYNALFLKLCEAYPNAFCYLGYSRLFGSWMGASPELLVEKINTTQYRTVSLAGTLTSSQFQWSDKEKNEQQLVTDFIAQKLSQANFNFELGQQKEIEIGRLRHLISEFKITSTNVATQNLIQLITLLHPTPAVAGLPRENALSFIKHHENFERNLYAGFFGVLKNTYARINVNLRCAQLFSNGLLLYAGAGITADSEAKLEWLETQNKMKVIASLLY